MKTRLSPSEYNSVANDLKTMKDIYWEVFRAMTRRFPKNSRTIKKLLKLDRSLTELYYQTEDEFFKDYPEKELKDFGK